MQDITIYHNDDVRIYGLSNITDMTASFCPIQFYEINTHFCERWRV